MVYTCPRCGYTTEKTTNYKKHTQLKNLCEPIINNVSIDIIIQELNKYKINNKFLCNVCHKTYASKRTLNNHLKSHNNEPELNDKFKKINEEINLLKTKISNLENNKVIINNPQQNNINNINNIIINNNLPNSFLDEDLTYISPNFAMQCAKKLNNGLIDFIKTIRFNPDHPENMNVKVHRLKKKTLYVFKNDRWEICDAKWTLEEMIIHGARILNQHLITNMDQEKLLDEDSQESRIQSWLLSILPKNNEKLLGNLSRSIYALILDNNLLLMEKEENE